MTSGIWKITTKQIFENTCSGKHQDQENFFYECNDHHVHDNKTITGLVDDATYSDKR